MNTNAGIFNFDHHLTSGEKPNASRLAMGVPMDICKAFLDNLGQF
jgi:hypothetical protein